MDYWFHVKQKEIKKVKNPPNIVIIYADDLGWVDVGYNKYSKFYETPYIDKLASEGLILNRFFILPQLIVLLPEQV